jgi:hypothetical protein
MDFSDLNATNLEGENALHVAVRWDDLDAARELIEAGIRLNQHGDLGETPLHTACYKGNLEMVELLVRAGADVFALTEGQPPFTLARFGGHDHVCDYLGAVMKRAIEHDQDAYIRARIGQLRREIERLERRLDARHK